MNSKMQSTTTTKKSYHHEALPHVLVLTNEANPSGKMRSSSPNTTVDEEEIIAVAARLIHQLSRHHEEYDSSQKPSMCTGTASKQNQSQCSSPRPDVILTPNEGDVLSGRGAGVNHHPGNAYFRKLIQSQKLSYVNADAPVKKKIIQTIVCTIQSKTGRFLKRHPTSGMWECLTFDEAKKKTGQALREDAPRIKRMKIIDEYRRRPSIEASCDVNMPSESFHLYDSAISGDRNARPDHTLSQHPKAPVVQQVQYDRGQGQQERWMTSCAISEQNEQMLQRQRQSQYISIHPASPIVTPRFNLVSNSSACFEQFPLLSSNNSASNTPFCHNNPGTSSSSEVPINFRPEWNNEWYSYLRRDKEIRHDANDIFLPSASSFRELSTVEWRQNNRCTPSLLHNRRYSNSAIGQKRDRMLNSMWDTSIDPEMNLTNKRTRT